jgi:hypothetical protein
MADLSTLINAIPSDAQDGTVITPDYFNTLKAAIDAIAGQLGPGAGGQNVNLTLLPHFQPVTGHVPWVVTMGAAADAGGNLTDGWLPLYLPDGAVIQQMVVIGIKPATSPAQFSAFASLVIMSVGATTATNLITVDLTSVSGSPFTTPPGTPNIPGTTPSSLKDLQTVKNSTNKYLIHAEVSPSPAAGTLVIEAIQVGYTTP